VGGLVPLSIYVTDREFNRVAPEETAAQSWLHAKGACVTKGGGGRFGLHIVGVDLSNSTMADRDLSELSQQLAGLRHLRTLELAGTCISDEGMKYLSVLQSLQYLDLSRTAVTAAGLAQVTESGGLPNVEQLDLSYTKVTHEGVRRLVNPRFPRLKLVGSNGLPPEL